MKIIHCADLHLESKMQTNLSKTKAEERKKEILLGFEKLAEYATTNNVKVVIVAGDMFDGNFVTNKTKKYVLGVVEKHQSIDFLYLSGNHDQNIFDGLELPKNFKIFGEQWQTFEYDNIAISGVANMGQNIYDCPKFDESKFNVVVLHGQIGKDIDLKKLTGKKINYLALGHEHSFKLGQMENDFCYAYCGCLEGRGFDEFGEKGFVLLDIQDSLKINLVPFAKRQFFEVKVDISNIDDWFKVEEEVFEHVKNIGAENFVQIVLVGEFSDNLQKHTELLSKKLAEKFYFARVEDNSVLKIDWQKYQNELSLKGEFIREVLNSKLSDEKKQDVILAGLKALEGESFWNDNKKSAYRKFW